MKQSIGSVEILRLLVDVEAMIEYAEEDTPVPALQEIADKLISILGIEDERD